METSATAQIQHAIQCQGDDGIWREWFTSPDAEARDREWAHLRAMKPTKPIRRVELEVLRSD